jgi:hypothetical protein
MVSSEYKDALSAPKNQLLNWCAAQDSNLHMP